MHVLSAPEAESILTRPDITRPPGRRDRVAPIGERVAAWQVRCVRDRRRPPPGGEADAGSSWLGENRGRLTGMEDETLFSVATLLGFTVRVMKKPWGRVVSVRHPVLAGGEDDVRLVLAEPYEIRQSKVDPDVFLFYRPHGPARWLCVVAKKVDNDDGFLITAYPTDAIKEGERRWTK